MTLREIQMLLYYYENPGSAYLRDSTTPALNGLALTSLLEAGLVGIEEPARPLDDVAQHKAAPTDKGRATVRAILGMPPLQEVVQYAVDLDEWKRRVVELLGDS